jgi:exonuclease SbcC
MINSIRLVNWRSHSDTFLEFRSGTNLLVGIMGAGKSSILEGISFALFGTFPALERRKLKMENLVRLSESHSKVSLEFSWEGSNYRVEREIERKKNGTSTKAEIFKDNQLIENGTSSVNSYIANLTSVDYDLFTRAIYSEQNNIEYFLNLDPRRRKQEIDTLLGLDKFETARSNIVTVSGRVKTKKKTLEENFRPEKIAELEAQEKGHSERLADSEKKLADVAAKLVENQKLSAGLMESFERMKKQKEKHDSLEKDAIRLAAQTDALEKEISPVNESQFEEMRGRLEALVKERNVQSESLKSIDARNSELSKKSGAVAAEIKSAKESKARMEKLRAELSALLGKNSLDELEAKSKGLERSILSCKSEQQSLKQQIAELSDVLSKLKPGMAECPLCSSALSEGALAHIKEERSMLISAKEKRIAELALLLEKNRDGLDGLLKTIRRASIITNAISGTEMGDIPALEASAAQIASELSSIEQQRKNLRDAADSISKEIEGIRLEIRKTEEMLRKMKQLGESRKKLSETKAQLEAIHFGQKEFDDLREKAEAARLEAERMRSAKATLELEKKTSADLLRLVGEELMRLRETKKQISSLYSLDEELAIYRNALLETQVGLRGNLTDAINGAMNELWPIFYPYHNYRALRLNVSEKDYVFEVNDGEWKNLDSIASGGERASAALTLRVALAMILTPNLSWLILDEPTHNLDSQAVELLSSALAFKVPDVVKQTFVITHDEAFMGSDFASSYRLTRDKEKNGSTKAESI